MSNETLRGYFEQNQVDGQCVLVELGDNYLLCEEIEGRLFVSDCNTSEREVGATYENVLIDEVISDWARMVAY